jgi:DNA-directed RNA polymerase subunit RPC12/RpoP
LHTDEPIPPEDAFDLIGHDIRTSIIRTLQEEFRRGSREAPYSDLKSRVGVRDSGQFNYHLQKLVGHFVVKADGAYQLSYAGRKAASAIAGGTYNEQASIEPRSVAGACVNCGDEALVLTNSDARFDISCSTCNTSVVHMPFPPGAVDSYEVDELKTAFDRWVRSWNMLSATGVCPECGSRMQREITEDQGETTIGNVDIRYGLDCTQCWMSGFLPIGCLLVDHPAVVSFHWNRGHEVHSSYLWEFEWALSKEYQEPKEEDDRLVELSIPVESDELRITVNNSLDIVTITETDG